MELSHQDSQINTLENVLSQKKSQINSNFKQIRNMAKHNQYLENVVDDYKKYYNFIKEQKEKQSAYFNMLNDYIQRLIFEEKMTEQTLNYTNKEQKRIINELSKIKHDLDEITEFTN